MLPPFVTIADTPFSDWDPHLRQLYARVQRWTPAALPPGNWQEVVQSLTKELRLTGAQQVISPSFFPELRRLAASKGIWGKVILGEIFSASAYADSTRQKVRQVEARFRAFRASLPAPCDSAPIPKQVVWFIAEEACRPGVNAPTTITSHIKDLGKAEATKGVHSRPEVKEALSGLEKTFTCYEPLRGPPVAPNYALSLFETAGPLSRLIGLLWVENALRPSDVKYLLLLPITVSEQPLLLQTLFQIKLLKRKNAQGPLPLPPSIQILVPTPWVEVVRQLFRQLTEAPLAHRRELLQEVMSCLIGQHGYAIRNGVVLTLGAKAGISHQEIGRLLGHAKSLDPATAHRYLQGPSPQQKEDVARMQRRFAPSDRFQRMLGPRPASRT